MLTRRFHIGHALGMALFAAAVAAALVLIARPAQQASDSASLNLTGAVAATAAIGRPATDG